MFAARRQFAELRDPGDEFAIIGACPRRGPHESADAVRPRRTATTRDGARTMRIERLTLIALALLPVTPGLRADLLITEVVSANDSTLTDKDGGASDWIEIYNAGSSPIPLGEFALTTDPDRASSWRLPKRALEPGGFLVVFASGKDRRAAAGEIHADFRLRAAGEYLALLDSSGRVLRAFTPSLPRLRRDEAFGLRFREGHPVPGRYGVLPRATPGAANPAESLAVVLRPVFSIDSGFFEESVELRLRSATRGARIRFTTDGTAPSERHGQLYTTPLIIRGTTPVRAMAFKSGERSSQVETRTYLFLQDVIRQSSRPPPGWPVSGINGQTLDYGMASPASVGASTDEVLQALRSLPTISLVIDRADFFDPSRGIYVNASRRGRSWERPVAVELIDPSSKEEGFRIPAGIRIRGGASRRRNYPRHAFRVYFREVYGEGELRYPLFGDEGAREFDDIDLRCSQNYAWSHPYDERSQHTYLRDVFARDCQADLGRPTTRSRYYHLFINGLYWGIYQTQEHSEASYAASYFGGKPKDYDVVKARHPLNSRDSLYATDGDVTAWRVLWETANAVAAGEDEEKRRALFRRLQGLDPDGRENPRYPVYLDVDNLIDYMLVIFYTGNFDAPITNFIRANQLTNNWFGIRRRDGRGGFKFFVHDSEHTLGVRSGRAQLDRTGPWPAGQSFNQSNPQWIHQQLLSVDEYRERFSARAQRVLFADGALSPTASLDRLNARVAQIDQAIIAEAARWGDAGRGPPKNKVDWLRAVETIRRVLRTRSDVVAEQLRRNRRFTGGVASASLVDAPLLPRLAPPRRLAAPLDEKEPSVTFLAADGTILYTLDGSDPKLPDGGISPLARVATGARRVERTLLGGNHSIRVVVPESPALGKSWLELDFDDRSWRRGRPPVGYELRNGYERLIELNLRADMAGRSATVYARSSFSADDLDSFDRLILRLRFEDGFVAYLNGVEVARENAPAKLAWNSEAAVNRSDSSAVEPLDVDITEHRAACRAGRNVLAMQGLNDGAGSSDFLLAPEIVAVGTLGGAPIAVTDGTELRARVFQEGEWSPLLVETIEAEGSEAAVQRGDAPER